jgi:hypothetical protein
MLVGWAEQSEAHAVLSDNETNAVLTHKRGHGAFRAFAHPTTIKP